MPFTVGDNAWTINNYRNRVTHAQVREITPLHIEVWNSDKEEIQFFAPQAPHISLGDYWAEGEPRAELVESDNAEALVLNDERLHREHAVRVRKAVDLFAKEPTEDAFLALRSEVNRWAGHTLRKVAA